MRKTKKTKTKKRGGATVPCPQCDSPTEVLVTRRDGNRVTRSRQCKSSRCRHKFSTEERVSR